MSSTKSLSVAEYSDVVIKKYLHQAYSEDPRDNLTKAAEEMYVLLRKLTDAAGGKSEDAKAPLKAVRNALDTIVTNYSEGTASPEVDSLFNLCRRLQELCEERILTNTDPVGGQQVQDHLRYRLTRLVTGSAWDAHIDLKLRVLQLIFSFMVKDNERLLEEARGVPSLKLGRTLSIGRARGSRDLGPSKVSKWSEAIDEIGRLPGTKLVPLMKMLLMDNMQMHAGRVSSSLSSLAAGGAGAGVEEGLPATPDAAVGPHAAGKGSPEVEAMNASLLNDLLGLSINEVTAVCGGGGPRSGVDSRQQQDPTTGSRRSSSPTPSSVAPSDDPFAASMGETRSEASYGAGGGGLGGEERMMMQHRMPVSLGPRSSSGTMSTTHTPPGIPTPPASGYYPAAAISTGAPGHFGGRSSSAQQQHQHQQHHMYGHFGGSQSGSSLPPSSPAAAAAAYHQQQMMHQQQYHQQQQMQMHYQQPYQQHPMYSTPPTNVYNSGDNFDAASPYLGMTEPFETHYFQDVAPIPDRKPAPLPSSPPMRGSGGSGGGQQS